MMQHRITTTDNPYDPFDDYENWFRFDEKHGYHTSNLLGTFINTSYDFPDSMQQHDNEVAIDSIIENDAFDMYRKVSKEVEITTVT